ncbi:hypothetical protein E4631_18545 [Hymenobacter sp. UV11]|uniref:hypothetical protein n=1 Tax=Hymenobacter sp. UV11 TaxID=1849735 RepID=UPI00105FEDAC|nr:hypothetical protein [Hymenobacter sp. UV11]TDN36419.1 hypothetical protein A8B98_08645 [Hymenobacter sp. UV11]TFZ64517.1 hypothetical protein E4631_18545 [Hymenobacter sp. UV11]
MFTFPYLLAAFVAATAATPPDTPLRPGVYFSSTEVLRNAPAHPGRVEHLRPASGHLVVVAAGTYTVHQVPVAHVWGYANAEHQVFRLVNHQAYLVTYQDSVVLYSRPRTVQYGRNATTFTEHFFSIGLDGDLHPLSRRQLRKQLTAN